MRIINHGKKKKNVINKAWLLAERKQHRGIGIESPIKGFWWLRNP